MWLQVSGRRSSFLVGYRTGDEDILFPRRSGTFAGGRVVHQREEDLPVERYCLPVYSNAFLSLNRVLDLVAFSEPIDMLRHFHG